MLTFRKVYNLSKCAALCFLVLLAGHLLRDPPAPPAQAAAARSPQQLARVMAARVARVRARCGASRHATVRSGQQLYVLWARRLVWCPVFKAASTNWMLHLLPLAGLSDEDADNLRDKLERAREPLVQDRYYNLYGRRIVASYREAAVASLGTAFFSAARHHGAPVAVAGRSAQLPSWWEFVQWLLDTGSRATRQLDEHWRPVRHNPNIQNMLHFFIKSGLNFWFSTPPTYGISEYWSVLCSDYCEVCVFSYNYIIHFENLEEEERYLSNLIDSKDVLKLRKENVYPKKHSSKDLLKKYFSLLEKQDVLKLYDLYEEDFLMFGYDINEYLS